MSKTALIFSRHYFERKWAGLSKFFSELGFTWFSSLSIVAQVLIIVWLVAAMYLAIVNAGRNYELLTAEKLKLEEVKLANKKLAQEAEYYASLEYKQRYAYDSLNLSRPGESLYLVGTSEREEFTLEKRNPEPVKQEDHSLWWRLLFAQIVREGM